MAVTRRTDYAMRFMLELASAGGQAPLPAARLAELADVPYEFARSILTELTAAGLLRSVRGAAGGFALARPASEISVADILQAMQETALLNQCVEDPTHCPRSGHCPMHGVWCEADEALMRFLSDRDLESIVGNRKGR